MARGTGCVLLTAIMIHLFYFFFLDEEISVSSVFVEELLQFHEELFPDRRSNCEAG